MAGPWEKFSQPAPAAEAGPWARFEPAESAPSAPVATPAVSMPAGASMSPVDDGILDQLGRAFDVLTGDSMAVTPIGRIEEAGGIVRDALIPDSLQRGWQSMKRNTAGTIDALTGAGEDSNAYRAQLARQREAYGADLEDLASIQAMSDAQSLDQFFDAAKANPSAIGEVIGESFGQQAVPLATMALSLPVGLAAGGASSFEAERQGAIDEAMMAAGVDLTDPVAVGQFLASRPDLVAEAERRGMVRGGIVGAADVVTGGLAGRFAAGTGATRALTRAGADAVLGVGGGAGGEAAAQLATDGEVTRLGDVFLEGAAEGPTTVAEGIASVVREARAQPRQQTAPPPIPAESNADPLPADPVQPRAAQAAPVPPRAPEPAATPEADEAAANDIMDALVAAGLVPQPVPEQGGNPEPVAPAAGSQPAAAVPDLAEQFTQSAPSSSAASVERPQQVQAVTGRAVSQAVEQPATAMPAEAARAELGAEPLPPPRPPKRVNFRLKPVDDTGKPRGLLDYVAQGGGLDRETFQRELGIDPAELSRRVPGGYVFRRRDPRSPGVPVGMTPDEFRGWLQTNNYAPRDQDDRPAEFGIDNAMDMFERAFRGGEDVFSYDQEEAVQQWAAARRRERDQQDGGVPVAPRAEPRDDVADVEQARARIDQSFSEDAPAQQFDEIPFQRREAPRASGIPAGLPAQQTTETADLARRINQWRGAERGAGEPSRFRAIEPSALPIDFRRAIEELGQATGTRVSVVRNLTPEAFDFNGVNFRNGVLYINENADMPALLVATHEWVHQFKRDQPALYQRLEDEVRRQGRLDAYGERLRREGETRPDVVAEELTADAVADAMMDPAFLRRIVEEGGSLRRAARAFLRYLDGLLTQLRGRNSAAYLQDVQAFRDELAAVLAEYRNTEERPPAAAPAPDADPMFRRRDAGRTPTNTDEFRRWFRDSKAINADGSPLIVYHGTGEEFDAFDRGRLASATGHASSGLGFFFTPDKAGAQAYADKASDFVPANAVVLETYLSIQNPYRMTLAEAQSIEDAAEASAMRMSLQAQGYDGVHIPEQNAWVAFRANQVKRTDNLGAWSPSDDRMMFQRRLTGDVFESALLRSVEDGKGAPKRGTAEQWKGWLDGAVRRGEFKQSERDWLDVDGWLQRQGGNVTRDALAEYVRANQVELEETMLAGESDGLLDSERQRYEELRERALNNFPRDFTEAEQREYDALLSKRKVRPLAKFSQYQLPGGTNYREVLLTLPIAKRDGFAEYLAAYRARFPNATTTDEEVREFHSRGVPVPPAGQTVVQRQADSPVYQSSHWDQPNVLAHVRMNDRTDAQGREVLFVEEIQSDWHQAGRRKGYRKPQVSPWESFKAQGYYVAFSDDAGGFEVYDYNGDPVAFGETEQEAINDLVENDTTSEGVRVALNESGVPDAPLKATDEWAMLAFKRVVREAVERGKSVIAWTTGDQQAERYDLSKQVDRIAYAKTAAGTFNIQVFRGGENVLNRFGVGDTEAEELVGKEIVQKMNDGVGEVNFATGYRELSGLNLKVGGEGMRSFYDRILPAAVNKWAKKFGGRASSAQVRTGKFRLSQKMSGPWMLLDDDGYAFENKDYATEAEARAALARANSALVHALEITPAMREAASGPMPLFQRRSVPQAQAEAARKRATVDSALGNPINGGALGWNPKAAKWEGSREARRKARVVAQDAFIALRDTQQDIEAATGRPLEDLQNVYQLENLMHGRTQAEVEALDDQHFDPLFDAMRKAGVTVKQLEDYLEARHAPERNREIAAINPRMPDGGSGMTTADARTALAGMDRAKLEPLARRVDAIVKETRKRMLDAGVITREAYDAMTAQYQYYVPLRGVDESKSMQEQARAGFGGGGLDIRTSGLKGALGRGAGNRATDILGEVIGDAQRAVIAAEKARVGRGLARLVLANPNPSFWQMEAVRTEQAKDSQGQVYQRLMNESLQPDVVHVMVKGVPYRIQFKDPNLAAALRNIGGTGKFLTLPVFRQIATSQRYIAATLTAWNPGFVPTNIARDLQFGLARIAAEHGLPNAGLTLARYPLAIRAMWRLERKKGARPGNTMDAYAREFEGAGGKTGWMHVASVDALSSAAMWRSSGSPLASGRRAGAAILKAIEDLNDTFENAMRLSYYAGLRDAGLTPQQAAQKAKDLTVNFNRKGTAGPALSAGYLFFNAAVQGTHALGRAVDPTKPHGRKILAGLGGVATLQFFLAAMASGMEDEDGEDYASKVPEWIKERNLWWVGSDGQVYTIPMPFGFNIATYTGSRFHKLFSSDAENVASGAKSAGSVAGAMIGDLTRVAVSAVFPVQVAQSGVAAFIPTEIGQHIVQQTANKDDFGRQIWTENTFDRITPRAVLGRDATPEGYKVIATALNRLGGGDDYTKPIALLDIAPEQIQFSMSLLTGGTGNWFGGAAQTAFNAAFDPEANEQRPTPLLQTFTRPLNDVQVTAAKFYERREAIEIAADRIRDMAERDGIDAAREYADSLPFMAGVAIKLTKGGEAQIRPGNSAVYSAFKDAEKAGEVFRDDRRQAYSTDSSMFSAERSKALREASQRQMKAQKELLREWNAATESIID